MNLLYLTACRVYGPHLAEVNNVYRASIAGQHPGVQLGGPGFDVAGLDSPLHLPAYIARHRPDVVFVADPSHDFWTPSDRYPDCPSLYSGIDELPVPVVIESGDSQFYHAETIRHLQARPDRAVCIRAESHRWRFDQFEAPRTSEPTLPPEDLEAPIFYLPHGAYDEMVEVSRGVEKTVDVLFSGSDMPDAYPARARIAKALRSMQDIKVDWLPHPSDTPKGTPPVIGPAFWRRIARARLAVAGTNCYRNLTMRYLEIPACGTLAIGDVPEPEGRRDEWARHMIDIGDAPPSAIAEVIRHALADPPWLAERTRAAREFVLSRHTFRAEWARVMGEIEAWIANL